MTEYGNLYVEKRRNKSEVQRRKRDRRLKKLLLGLAILILILLIYIIFTLCSLIAKTLEYQKEESDGSVVVQDTEKETYIDKYKGIPEELLEVLEKNSETEAFVLNYPLKKGTYSKADLDECLNQSKVPLLLQWDSRWGYYGYGSSIIGVTGCGPTCLSMVSIHLLQDAKLTPVYLADYAKENGYYAEGIGTAWDFMTYGAENLGLNAQEVTLDENVVMRHLRQGRPIICAMGPGAFTESGHFIVLVGVEEGKIRVNDPNSKARSEKLWTFEEFKYQIKNMWAYSVRS